MPVYVILMRLFLLSFLVIGGFVIGYIYAMRKITTVLYYHSRMETSEWLQHIIGQLYFTYHIEKKREKEK